MDADRVDLRNRALRAVRDSWELIDRATEMVARSQALAAQRAAIVTDIGLAPYREIRQEVEHGLRKHDRAEPLTLAIVGSARMDQTEVMDLVLVRRYARVVKVTGGAHVVAVAAVSQPQLAVVLDDLVDPGAITASLLIRELAPATDILVVSDRFSVRASASAVQLASCASTVSADELDALLDTMHARPVQPTGGPSVEGRRDDVEPHDREHVARAIDGSGLGRYGLLLGASTGRRRTETGMTSRSQSPTGGDPLVDASAAVVGAATVLRTNFEQMSQPHRELMLDMLVRRAEDIAALVKELVQRGDGLTGHDSNEGRLRQLEVAAGSSRDRIVALEAAALDSEAAALVSDARIVALASEVEQLRAAQDQAAAIEEAKRTLMSLMQISADAAFAVLVAASQRDEVPLHAVASRITSRGEAFDR